MERSLPKTESGAVEHPEVFEIFSALCRTVPLVETKLPELRKPIQPYIPETVEVPALTTEV